eukprot:gene21969-29026_t
MADEGWERGKDAADKGVELFQRLGSDTGNCGPSADMGAQGPVMAPCGGTDNCGPSSDMGVQGRQVMAPCAPQRASSVGWPSDTRKVGDGKGEGQGVRRFQRPSDSWRVGDGRGESHGVGAQRYASKGGFMAPGGPLSENTIGRVWQAHGAQRHLALGPPGGGALQARGVQRHISKELFRAPQASLRTTSMGHVMQARGPPQSVSQRLVLSPPGGAPLQAHGPPQSVSQHLVLGPPGRPPLQAHGPPQSVSQRLVLGPPGGAPDPKGGAATCPRTPQPQGGLSPPRITKVSVCKFGHQQDGSGCGVFACTYAELLSRGVMPPFTFAQQDIDTIRKGMAAQLLHGAL